MTVTDSIVLKDGYLYDPASGKQRKATDEEHVRQEMIRTLVSEYGYPLECLKTEFPIKVGSQTKPVDIAIFPMDKTHRQEAVSLIVECKAPKVKMADKKDGVGQLISYVASCPACAFGLWTNGGGFERQVLHKYAPTDLRRVDYDIPRFGHDHPLDEAPRLSDLVPASTASLKWRFRKCHDIITQSGDDKMTAFWEFLKVIQVKVEDEKEGKERAEFFATPEETRTQDGHARVQDRINRIYKKLVAPHYGLVGFQGDSVNMKPGVLARVVAELQDYALIATNPTVKGAAYEEIVGANLRGDKGEFFTPRVVVDAAVGMLDVTPDDLCCEPACGSGGFSVAMLLAGANAVQERYVGRGGEWTAAIANEKESFARNRVVSNDINSNLARACRMNMLMNNDGSERVYDQDILEPPHNWTCEGATELRESLGLNQTQVGGRAFVVGEVTALCTNPPFGSNITRVERHVLDQFDLGRDRTSQIVEILFLERCVQLLKPDVGRAAIVVPQSILNNPGLEYVRTWLLSNTVVEAVVELPVETFLISGREGTGTLTALIFVRRRPLDQCVRIANGTTPDRYPVFMAIADSVGYDRRGKTEYRRDSSGDDILVDTPLLDVKGSPTGVFTKDRVIANDLPGIVRDFVDFKRRRKEGQLFFDPTVGTFRSVD